MKRETIEAINQAMIYLNAAQLEEKKGDVAEAIWQAMDLLNEVLERGLEFCMCDPCERMREEDAA